MFYQWSIRYCSLVFGLFLLNQSVTAQVVTRGPYLQFTTPNSAIVKWRTDVPTNSKVWYGTDVNNLNDSVVVTGLVTDHEIEVSSLSANSIFYYAIGTTTVQLEGQTNEHYFKTHPQPGTSQPVNIWVLGDAGSKDDNQRNVRDAYYNYNGSNHIDMILLLGDNAYEDGTDEEFQLAWFENMYEDRLINSVMWSCYGNHEAGASTSTSQTGPYFDIFNFPTNGELGGAPSGTESYYSFDYANIHVISLNNYDEDREPDGPMLQWLEADLAANTQDWIIALIHYPVYSGHNENSSDTNSREKDTRENAIPMLEAAGVDLVLTGHSHTYQRSFLINGHYDVSATFDPKTMALDLGDGNVNGDAPYVKAIGGPQDGKGTVYMVSGAAGKLSENVLLRHPVMYHNNSVVHGSVAIEVDGMEMSVKHIDENETIDDYFTIVKQPEPPSVEITYPVNNSYFGELAGMTIMADATDSNGNISQVEFYVDNVLIGIDDTAPYTMDWIPPGLGAYRIKTIAEDNEGHFRSAISNIQIGPVATCEQISSSNYDSEEDQFGEVSLGSSDLELMVDADSQLVGLRFVDLRIPHNAVINSANIQFTAKDTVNIDPCVINIFAELVDNAESLTNDDFDLSERIKTDTFVTWTPAQWKIEGERGAAQLTVNLAPVLQELVYRPSYSDKSSIVILLEGGGLRRAYSFNGDPNNAPTMCVEYNPYCQDADNDGVCDAIDPCPFDDDPNVVCFDEDNDGFNSEIDCDDNNASVNPGSTEIPNNAIDEDCDGTALIIDEDNDGFNSDEDCNDNNASVNPGSTEIPNNAVDEDCDGTALIIDEDNDGFNSEIDCDDNNASVNPGSTEIPNNAIDEDCDGTALIIDEDNDGFNSDEDCDDANASINPNGTEIPNNAVDENCDGTALIIDEDNDGFNSDEDCNDNNASVNPGSTEIPNNAVDEDCDGTALIIDDDNDGYNSDEDCDDNNADINPGMTEIPNNAIDEDCDGTALIIDDDNDGFNSDEDCDDNNADINPGMTEIPNNAVDEDCDGTALIIDEDNDGYNSDEDCDDNNADINPGMTEIPNNAVDEDCDGTALIIDEDNDGFNSDEDCDDNNADINPGMTEIPNNAVDEDCDGTALIIDEDNDGFNSDEDCDDNNADINPGMTEIPNNAVDEDCDGTALIIDEDNDGFNSDEDCDDNNADINPGMTEIPNNAIDEDCDGTALIIDEDNDGFNSDEDCDDNNADINPGMTEIPNNAIDEDCDGTALIIDEDNDGYNSDKDCDDNNADINPGMTEIPNNAIDEDCDGTALIIDEDNDGYNSDEDCDESNANINPGAIEIPNNDIDEDCDGDDLISSTTSPLIPNIKVSPNPTGGLLHVNSIEIDAGILKICNLTGNCLIEQPFSQRATLDLGHLPSGCFILYVQSGNQIWPKRIVLF